jgi:type II secretory pathway pseudopilin PulG
MVKKRKSKAFTLIETVFATILFGVLVVATLGIVRYVGQTSGENKDAIAIASELKNNRTILKTLVNQQGWETFLSTHMSVNPGTGALDSTTYSFLNPYQPSIASGAIAEGEWRVTFAVDPTFGPYLQRIQKDTAPSQYVLLFSAAVYGKAKGINDLVPIINAPVRWSTEAVGFGYTPSAAGTTLTIPGPPFPPNSGYRVKPTEYIVDAQERADVSYRNGVPIPESTPVPGYPSMIKLRFQTLRSGSNVYFNDILTAEEAL